MKTKIILSAAVLFIFAGLFAAAPAAKKVSRSYHKHHKTYGQGEYYQISRDNYSYLIYFQWIKPTQKRDQQVVIGLPEPNFWSGFNRRGMFNLKINGISNVDLEPKEVTVFNDGKTAGINVPYNFDGVKTDIRFFMDDSSPLLHVEIIPSEKNKPDAVKSITLNMGVTPTIDGQKNGSYKREIITPINTYNQRGWQKINPADTYFVMYDTKYEGSQDKPKSNGPAFMKFDTSILQSGRFHYGNSSTISFEFKIKPDTKKIAFSVLELKKKSTNKEFFAFLEQQNLIRKAENKK